MIREKIVTHSGPFHADDVFAVATLLLYLKRDKDVESVDIVRSRETSEIEKGDYVVDVGFEYDPGKNRFDHHQKEDVGNHESGIPYASFGLVWKKFGEEVCESAEVASLVENVLVEPVDAGDVGMNICAPIIEGVWQYGIGRAISSFNPDDGAPAEAALGMFKRAVEHALIILKNEIKKISHEEEIRPQIIETFESSGSKDFIVFEGAKLWSRTFMNLVLAEFEEPIYFAKEHKDGTWQLVCVQDPGFVSRKALPEEWRGRENEEFSNITGIPGSVFCHRTGFMAIVKTREDLMKLAKLALEA